MLFNYFSFYYILLVFIIVFITDYVLFNDEVEGLFEAEVGSIVAIYDSDNDCNGLACIIVI